jgi:hypothetical protein
MGFYTFSQNNSGGHFIGPLYVIVEAGSADEANWRATHYGPVYFNGVEAGADCECCGDRWSEQWSRDHSDDVPLIYGKPVAEYEAWEDGDVLIIRADGTSETVAIKATP